MERPAQRRIAVALVGVLVAGGVLALLGLAIESRPVLILGFVLMAVVTPGLWWMRSHRAARRDQDASRLGLRYSRADPVGLETLPLILLARPRAAIGDVAWGRWQGEEVTVFDLSWSQGQARLVVTGAVEQLSRSYPRLVIAGDRIARGILGHTQIQRPPSMEGELKGFAIGADDPGFAQRLLDEGMKPFLLSVGTGWSFELAGDVALCLRDRVAFEIEPVLGRLREFRHILRSP